jgi:CheY-like chemotaxis protein
MLQYQAINEMIVTKQPINILLVEDESFRWQELGTNLLLYLKKCGIDATLTIVDNKDDFTDATEGRSFWGIQAKSSEARWGMFAESIISEMSPIDTITLSAVISDFNIAGYSGGEVLRRIKGVNKDIPVLSATSQPNDAKNAQDTTTGAVFHSFHDKGDKNHCKAVCEALVSAIMAKEPASELTDAHQRQREPAMAL